ncbi:MAG: hypothetical protein EOO87_09025, partial [Pedobacter sp.]
MKKYIIPILLLLSVLKVNAQSYKKLADSALKLMWNARDESGYRKSFDLYEKAFNSYPKDVNDLGYYKAAVLAGELKEFDKAFIYLNKLLELNTDLNTTWGSLAGKYTKSEYKNLLSDKRWPAIEARAQKLKTDFFNRLAEKQAEFQVSMLERMDFSKLKTGEEVYQAIKNFNNYNSKKEANYSIKFKVTDSLFTSYYVSLPNNYDPKKRYALMFFL